MMMSTFLQEAFRRFGGNSSAWNEQAGSYQSESSILNEAIERVVDETSRRMRAIPGYRRRLEGPVTETFRYIDDLVERMPGSFLCSRSTFSADPRVKSFFVNPNHLQEVFSQNKDIRELFEANPNAEECCALVCMHMEERQKFGAALVGDRIHREVMQTTVSFMKHQLYSPGIDEAEARRALKCCIFNGVLTSIRQQFNEDKVRHMERKQRLSMLRSQLRKATREDTADKQQTNLQTRIEALEHTLMHADQRPPTIDDRLALVTKVLSHPEQFISASFQHLHLTHMGIKVNQGSQEPAYELDIAKIRIAAREPRVAALVRFPRCELLPKMQISLETDALFPA